MEPLNHGWITLSLATGRSRAHTLGRDKLVIPSRRQDCMQHAFMDYYRSMGGPLERLSHPPTSFVVPNGTIHDIRP